MKTEEKKPAAKKAPAKKTETKPAAKKAPAKKAETKAETKVDLAMVKELNGRDWLSSDDFYFEIEPVSFSTGVHAVAAFSANANSTPPPIENDSGFTLPT